MKEYSHHVNHIDIESGVAQIIK